VVQLGQLTPGLVDAFQAKLRRLTSRSASSTINRFAAAMNGRSNLKAP
jgi:hypothetical protein